MEDSNLIALDLSNTSEETLELFMNETADEAIFEEILEANKTRLGVVRLVYEHPDTPEAIRKSAAELLSLPALKEADVDVIKKKAAEKVHREPLDMRKQRLVQGVQKLSMFEKIRMGMRGNGEVRGVLLRDPNKLVIMSVLENPRITESEVETVARNRSTVDDALRAIAKNREWTKNYSIKLALVTNPKTPAGIAMNLVSGLKTKDLSQLEKNKNVSEAVRSMAKKLVKKSRE